jgi:hypothetical protein
VLCWRAFCINIIRALPNVHLLHLLLTLPKG